MKILLSWLREFVDVPGTAADIAATMSVRGFAVEGIEPLADGDAVIDFEVTANRPDCLCVSGIAREVATAYGLQVRRPAVRTRSSGATAPAAHDAGEAALQLASLKSVDEGEIEITIENPDLCPRYAGAIADVTVGPSPEWMQARLRAAGVRPISNIVDVTNYVLLELGQPMHAFDRARLRGGQIRVRTARPGETIRTLDGQMRTLAPEMLVIADAEVAVAVAGVMGGADSEVSAGTTEIVLESAYFNPLSVRRTSKRLGLKTEASTRFERGTDPRLPVTAMERACALLELIGAGQARGTVIDRYPARVEPRVLRLRRSKIAGLLGVEVGDADVKRVLDSLGFALRDAEDGWDVTVPTRRVDVVREVDLIEELARHIGFDRIPVTFPVLDAAPAALDPRITRARRLRAALTGAGFSEAVTFGFIASAAAAHFAGPTDVVAIANPLSESFGVLRPTLLAGLVAAVGHNQRHQRPDVKLFEIGGRFSIGGGERQTLACAWAGAGFAEHWSSAPTRQADFFDIKGIAERVADVLAVDLTCDVPTTPVPWLVAGRAAAAICNGQTIGVLGQLQPAIAERLQCASADPVYVLEIDLDAATAVARSADVHVATLPRYPSVTRDVSILIDDTLSAAAVRQTIHGAAPPTLVAVREFDRYAGKGVPEGKVSLSLRLTYRSSDRTLTDADVQSAMDAVLSALRDRHGAVQR